MIILQQFMALSCNIYEDLSYKRFIICHLKEENIMRSNKICSIILSGIIAASTFASVSAAEVGEAYTSGVAECQIIIDNSSLDLNGTTIYSKNGVAMAPLRLIGEALGFEVIWNESGQSVFLDNGEVNTTVYLGADSYYTASSKAIGMSAPESLGAAAETVDNVTYVPAELFSLLLSNPDAVNILGNSIYITVQDTKMQLPNPYAEYASTEEAEKALGFDAAIPSIIPDGYVQSAVYTIGESLLQLDYAEDEKRISYRTAMDNGDISGDYNAYDDIKTVSVNGADVELRRDGELIRSAVWNKGEYAFSISSDAGLSEADIILIIENIK